MKDNCEFMRSTEATWIRLNKSLMINNRCYPDMITIDSESRITVNERIH